MGLIDQFAEELAVIKKTRLAFATGFIVLSILIGWVEYKFIFQELLALKDEQINALKEQVQGKSKDVSAQSNQGSSQSQHPSLATGDANAVGTGNVANTGNSSTINNETLSPNHRKTSVQH